MLIKTTHVREIFVLIIVKLLLEYLYIYFVAQIFSYAGFRYDLIFSNYLLGWIVI